jgi:hypothetical protein
LDNSRYADLVAALLLAPAAISRRAFPFNLVMGSTLLGRATATGTRLDWRPERTTARLFVRALVIVANTAAGQ